MDIAPAQCRAARALLDWSQDRLEGVAGVARKTIVDFERGVRQPHPRTLAAIRAAFGQAGVVFISAGETGPGVMLAKPIPHTAAA